MWLGPCGQALPSSWQTELVGAAPSFPTSSVSSLAPPHSPHKVRAPAVANLCRFKAQLSGGLWGEGLTSLPIR